MIRHTSILLAVVGFAVSACEQPTRLGVQVGSDVQAMVVERNPERRVSTIDEIIVGDGWDDGVELEVRFTSVCTNPTPACRDHQQSEHLSYTRQPDGRWRRLD